MIKSFTDPELEPYSYEKLLLKLSQLHEFYFDPKGRIKDSVDALNDEKKKQAELEEYYEIVKNTIPFLHLYKSSEYRDDYSYLVPGSINEWETHQYFKLYSFF